MPENAPSTHKWQTPEILLVAAACFAMGAVGFFIAVFLQTRTGSSGSYSNSQQVPIEMKEKVMQQQSDTSAHQYNAGAENQYDQADPQAAAKLKVLESLGAH